MYILRSRSGILFELRQTYVILLCIGLRMEDLYDEENKDVAAALKMLPEKEDQLRLYRLRRAMDLSLKHAILPEDQWTKPEEVRWPRVHLHITLTRHSFLAVPLAITKRFFQHLLVNLS